MEVIMEEKYPDEDVDIDIEEEEEEGTVVIDIGTGSARAGWSGEETPSIVFPTIIGKPKLKDEGLKDAYIGHEAIYKCDVLSLTNPVERGKPQSWDDMEKIFHYLFHDELQTSPDEVNLLICEPPALPKTRREKLIQTMFETYNTHALYCGKQAVLSLFAIGKTTGLVLDSGHGITHAVPVYDGYAISHAVSGTRFGGVDICHYLRKLISHDDDKNSQYFSSTSSVQRIQQDQTMKDIKEKLAYCAINFKSEYEAALRHQALFKKKYELPDGRTISLANERFQCAEAFFHFKLCSLREERQAYGIQNMIYDSIFKSAKSIRQSLFDNVVLSGGNGMFLNLDTRLNNELVDLIHQNNSQTKIKKVRVRQVPNGSNSAWIGGSMLSSISAMNDMWISKEEYEESGPPIIHRKCF